LCDRHLRTGKRRARRDRRQLDVPLRMATLST
jgi:hypothetical protein